MRLFVWIVDDHPLISEGMHNILTQSIQNDMEIRVVRELTNGLLALSCTPPPDLNMILFNYEVACFDTRMVIKEVQMSSPETKVVIYNAPNDLETARTFLTLGAMAYIVKGEPGTQIVNAVCAALQNKRWLTPTLGALAVKHLTTDIDILPLLRKRECDILLLLAEGLNNKEIANRLSLAEQTVKNTISSLYNTLNVESRGHLILQAQQLTTWLGHKIAN